MSDATLDAPRRASTRPAVTPYLAVAGARAAIDWYAAAFGAHLRGEPIVMDDGRIGHAELEIGGGLVMLSDQAPEIGVVAPSGGASVSLHLEVPDTDAAAARAVGAGATLDRPPNDTPYGRNAVVIDPFGHRWMLMTPPTRYRLEPGDIGYASLWVPDVERAAAFFSTVLGWRMAGHQVEGQTLPHGMWGGVEPPRLFVCFAVDDVAAAIERVRAAGGTAGEPTREPYGLIAECVDDQGVRFAVYEHEPDRGLPHLPANGVKSGDVSYVTMEVVDSARTRAFYGRVLGWTFTPGRVEDGWQVDDVAPMVGISGGHARATTVPMYRVDDISAAVERVRGAGGTATDPVRQPYGATSTCADDQGTRFYLGAL